MKYEYKSICRLCGEVVISHSNKSPDLCQDCTRISRMVSRQADAVEAKA